MRMIGLQSNLIKKYFEPLDKFIVLRVFSSREVLNLFQSVNIENKVDYTHLVLNACVVDFTGKVYSDILQQPNHHAIVEDLYKLCISANSALDINKVALPISEENGSMLHLLEKKQSCESTPDRLKKVHESLISTIVGQDHAIESVERALKKSFLNLRNLKRPPSVFLFVGRTGVGKTELAKILSTSLYDSPSRLVKINCSEYSLSHEYAKLLGAPPGYVGYDEGGTLSNSILANNEVITLFDEVEKADPSVHNLLLQIMDEGVVHDSKGRVLDFTKSIIILTSNVGAAELSQLNNKIGFVKQSVDYSKVADCTREALKARFKPEFLNRISNVVVFRNLTEEDCVRIADKFLGEVSEYASRIPISLSYSKDVPGFLAHVGYSEDFGAREIRRIVDEYVLHPLSDLVIDEKFKPGASVLIKVKGDRLSFAQN